MAKKLIEKMKQKLAEKSIEENRRLAIYKDMALNDWRYNHD